MELNKLPNIGNVLANKLKQAEIPNAETLKNTGSEQAIIKIACIDRDTPCIQMLYALEGAIQGIRWHGLSKERKEELSDFYKRFISEDK